MNNISEVKKILYSLKRKTDPQIIIDNQQQFFTGGFEPLQLNMFGLIVLAGRSAFSKPRIFFDNILDYQAVQISIFESIKNKNTQINPNNDNRFKECNWTKYFGFIDNAGKYNPSYMGYEVPIDEACNIIRYVNRISNLKGFF